jgi:tetratricopeptide (TPR) repeat protein
VPLPPFPVRRAAAGLMLLAACGACAGPGVSRQQNAEAHYRMASAYLQQTGGIQDETNRRAAFPEITTAISFDPNKASYHRLLGAMYLADRDYPSAEREVKRALQLDPAFPEARNDLGSIYAAQGKLQEAVREFKAAIANQSYSTPQLARRNLARASYQLGDFTEAASAYERYLETVPDDADARASLGMSYVRLGRLAEAEKAFSASIALRPDSAPTRYELGMVLFKLNRRQEAVEQFRAVAALDPHGDLGEQSRTYLKLLR